MIEPAKDTSDAAAVHVAPLKATCAIRPWSFGRMRDECDIEDRSLAPESAIAFDPGEREPSLSSPLSASRRYAIGKQRDGSWVVSDSASLNGGIFRTRDAATDALRAVRLRLCPAYQRSRVCGSLSNRV